jgi:hypothetical protein
MKTPPKFTPDSIQRLRGSLKRKPGGNPLIADWAAHKREEGALEHRLRGSLKGTRAMEIFKAERVRARREDA